MFGTSRVKRHAVWAALGVGGAGLVVALLLGLTQCDPEFYHQIERLSPEQRAEESRQFVRRSTGLWNRLQNDSRWTGQFQERQVNAWLAGDFQEKHGSILPDGLREPRVAFRNGRLALAVQARCGPCTAVMCLLGRLWLPDPNVIAFEIEVVRAGRMPVPATLVTEMVTKAAESAGLDLQWKKHAGNHVAWLRLGGSEADRSDVGLEQVELRPGMLVITGRSRTPDGQDYSGEHTWESTPAGMSLNVQSADSSLRN
jgi:hypothetical protein